MATTEKGNVEIVEGLYDAFNQGDIETVVAGFADDITWIEPEGSPIASGTFHGPDAVLENVFASLDELFESFEVSVDRLIDGGDAIVMEGAHRGTTSDGDVVEVPAVHVSDMQDGKLQQFANYEDTARTQQHLEQ